MSVTRSEPSTPSIDRTLVGPKAAEKPVALQLYTMEEVAAQLLVSRRWLEGLIKIYPFYRIAGRRKVFTQSDIQRLYEALPRPPSSRTFISSMIRSGVRTPELRVGRSAEAREQRKGQASLGGLKYPTRVRVDQSSKTGDGKIAAKP